MCVHSIMAKIHYFFFYNSHKSELVSKNELIQILPCDDAIIGRSPARNQWQSSLLE